MILLELAELDTTDLAGQYLSVRRYFALAAN
jgi:hypothetical protein